MTNDFFSEDEYRALYGKSSKKSSKRGLKEVSYHAVINFNNGSKYISSFLLPNNTITIMTYKDSVDLRGTINYSELINGLKSLPSCDSLRDKIISNTVFINQAEGVAKNFRLPLELMSGFGESPNFNGSRVLSIFLLEGNFYVALDLDDKEVYNQAYRAVELFIVNHKLRL